MNFLRRLTFSPVMFAKVSNSVWPKLRNLPVCVIATHAKESILVHSEIVTANIWITGKSLLNQYLASQILC